MAAVMTPSVKRWPTDEEHISDDGSEDELCTESGVTAAGTLDQLSDVLLDILEELSQMHELLRQRWVTTSQI